MKSLIASIALLAAGCGASTQLTAATLSDGTRLPFCVEVIQPITIVKARVIVVGCASVESEVVALEQQAKALYPAPTYKVQRVASK